MKTIGLLGGMSWESTVTYYRIINQGIQARLGGFHSGKIALYSVDFAEIEALQTAGAWEESAAMLIEAARNLERASADCIVICTNTMHKVAPQIQAGIGVPVIHIADATGKRVLRAGIGTVALLGTKYTMQDAFYREKIEQAGIRVLIPDGEDIERINRIIFQELCLGTFSPDSKTEYLRVIDDLAAKGAEGVILGCTEIGLLVSQADTDIPLFDTTRIHAESAVAFALQ